MKIFQNKAHKINLLNIVVVLLFCLNSVAQSYNMNNTGVTTCTGTFYDSGGAAGNYGNNQNYTKTFCSGTTDAIKIEFTEFDLDDAYDFLYVYDGNSTASPIIGIYSTTAPTYAFISSGTCLTFKFTSDCCFNYTGWKANISCITPPPCGANPSANNICSSATYITNLNGYCGNTSSSYTADFSADLLSDFCGSIENNSWLKFTADDIFVEFNIWTSSCSIGDGIQIQVFSTNDCSNFTPVSTCFNPFNDVNGNITATGLTIGQDYYMMIDGNNGDNCSFKIGATSGIALPIELINFNGKHNKTNHSIELSWETANEIESDFFILERSNNAIAYIEINQIKAAGNSTRTIQYNYTDRDIFEGIQYYRLKMVDFNGSIKTSSIIAIESNSKTVKAYPNPFQNILSIIGVKNSNLLQFQIINEIGSLIFDYQINDENIIPTFETENYNNGVYFIKYIYENEIVVEKVIKN